jgi:hypothetical protein
MSGPPPAVRWVTMLLGYSSSPGPMPRQSASSSTKRVSCRMPSGCQAPPAQINPQNPTPNNYQSHSPCPPSAGILSMITSLPMREVAAVRRLKWLFGVRYRSPSLRSAHPNRVGGGALEDEPAARSAARRRWRDLAGLLSRFPRSPQWPAGRSDPVDVFMLILTAYCRPRFQMLETSAPLSDRRTAVSEWHKLR